MDTLFDESTTIAPPRPGTAVGAMTVIELAQAAGVTPHVVRHYTRIGLLLPQRDRHNGYKLFNRSDLNRLLFIRRAKLLGYRLADIRSILEEARRGGSPCPHQGDLGLYRADAHRATD